MSNLTCEQYILTLDDKKLPIKSEYFINWQKSITPSVPEKLKSEMWDNLYIQYITIFADNLSHDKLSELKIKPVTDANTTS